MSQEILLEKKIEQSVGQSVLGVASLETPIILGEGATDDDHCNAEDCRSKLATHTAGLSGTLGEALECHSSEKISTSRIEAGISKFDATTVHELATELHKRNLMTADNLRLVEEGVSGCNREEADRLVAQAMISSFGEIKSLIAISRIIANDPSASSFRERLIRTIFALEVAIVEAQNLVKDFQRRQLLPQPQVEQKEKEQSSSVTEFIKGSSNYRYRVLDTVQASQIDKLGSSIQQASKQIGIRMHLLQIQDQITRLKEEVARKEVAIVRHPGDDYPLICQRNAAQLELDGAIKEAEQWRRTLNETPVLAA